jgi:DNA primase large subunit
MTAKALPGLDEDDRLVPMLNSLSQGFLAGVPAEWTSAPSAEGSDELKAEMIDEVAQKHYPLCMRHLHQTLRREKRLTHFGRLQYGLFLKVRPQLSPPIILVNLFPVLYRSWDYP